MGDREAERQTFETFLCAKPRFAGRKVVDWTQPEIATLPMCAAP